MNKSEKLEELALALEMNSGTEDMSVYVCKATGEIVLDAEAISGEPCPVEAIEWDDRYVCLPDKRELDLGTRLVWRFVERQIPGLEPKVRQIFSRRGAYRRWKDFLAQNELLDTWYAFQEEAQREALLQWCSRCGVRIEDAP